MARTVRLLVLGVRGLLALGLLAALVAGLPWALVYGVGWPLPDHLPSLDELGSVLMAPMSTTLLLDSLACLLWVLWLVFVLDVAACALDVARGARWPHVRRQAGPVRRVATVLVGALLVAMLGRTATAAPAALPEAGPSSGAAPAAASRPSTMPFADQHPASRPALAAQPGTEQVRPPQDGVHDSLWRIAQRCLGDGDRWPEIWSLNRGNTQPGGRVLSSPNLIHPGDLLHIPAPGPVAAPAVPPPPPRAVPAPFTEPAPAAPGTTTSPPPVPVPSGLNVGTDTATGHSGWGAVTWGGGEVFVSLGLAAAVSSLLVLARRRRQAHYRSSSGRGEDGVPVSPVVYQLRLAHLRARHHDEDTALAVDGLPDDTGAADADIPVLPRRRRRPVYRGDEGPAQVRPAHRRRVVTAAAVGTRTGPETPSWAVDIALDATAPHTDAGGTDGTAGEATHVALDLARVHGLGLIGPGGYAATRALLLSILTTARAGTSAPRVLVPTADLARLLGVPAPRAGLPQALTVVTDLDTTLAALDTPEPPPRPAILIATPPREPKQQARLQHLLDNGAQHGVTALLLGQWRPGVTAYVTATGIISATDPGLGEPLRGTRSFTLPETATRELLRFCHTTQAADPRDAANNDTEPYSGKPVPERSATSPQAAPAQPEASGDNSSGRLEITAGRHVPEPAIAGPAIAGRESRPLPRTERAQAPRLASLRLAVFGTPALHWRPHPARPDSDTRDLSGELSSRPVELLVYLAVHPGGASRDGIVDALWPDQPPRNPASVLRTVISRVRRTLDAATLGAAGNPIHAEHGHYRLDPAVVEVDYWDFADAVTARRAATTPAQRTGAYEAIVAHYGGSLAEGLDAEWLVASREATRRDALEAVAALARARVADDPDYTLDLLETARAFDPHNELLYRDIMRMQHALSRHDEISRTLTLLRTRLAEIGLTPTADTVTLARRLRERETGIPLGEPSPRFTAR
ncbi:BTAD domain-containing putative transcriptional regulator [Amycolatopsis camponoti]|uniref:BTAD domain-containing putative transcriptional regulator n=1 Tax=Amycolatopsis camponoti TaxID=2606593 RepID=UPI001E50B866|nr:BTAD domain-containing putative transcriptional regulator [Amycolatopsis camponoti]